VVFCQNHDQVGNRVDGGRLTQQVSFEDLKLAAGAVLLSPFISLVFMGEEYGEPAPFPYFTSHGDAGLAEAVRHGRSAEFACFGWSITPPDPQDERTFLRAKLTHNLKHEGQHRVLRAFYQELLRLRKSLPSLGASNKKRFEVTALEEQRVIVLRHGNGDDQVYAIFNYSRALTSTALSLPRGNWQKILDSADPRWLGSGTTPLPEQDSDGLLTLPLNGRSFIVLVNETQKT